MKCIYKLIILFGTLPLIYSRQVEFFRKDYTYIKELDTYYKVHWQPLMWDSAFMACDNEGATLYYPTTPKEMALVKNLTVNKMEHANVTTIFIGVHDKFVAGEFITVDGHPAPSIIGLKESYESFPNDHFVLMNIEKGLFSISSSTASIPYPFICKKMDTEFCPTIDPGYKYVKSLKKCYKVNKREVLWSQAMQTCYMEGGILTVIQNEGEAVDIYNSLSLKNEIKYHVGVRRIYHETGDFYTIKGQKMDEVYQNPHQDGRGDDCGAIYVSDSKLYTGSTDCGFRPSICEMEVNAISATQSYSYPLRV